jgi:dihydrofolate synthase/folylpolyglutamate synthase
VNPEPALADWTPADAERYLLSLELFGMRFGLERMRRLAVVLGHPRFESVHVVGTNGKSSTTRMIAALLEEHGKRTGSYTSPHLISFCERVELRGSPIAPERFAQAVASAARAAAIVDRTSPDRVTQFEALTAAAFFELGRSELDVAVIEAGLGGRYDATNVLDSSVQVLTNVGLEHTRWLGPTVRDIAREKLDVVRPGSTLVLGSGLHPDALDEARRTAGERGARIVAAPPSSAHRLAARGAFQQRNFALAAAAAEAYLGHPLDPGRVAAAAAKTTVPGRFQVLEGSPETVLDGAHNLGGIEALVESLPAFLAGRRLVAVISILDDKDAAGMLAALLGHCAAVVCTASSNPRALSPATLASLASQLDGPASELEPDPRRALARARELAGAGGVVLATGSIYLVADLLRPPGAGAGATL